MSSVNWNKIVEENRRPKVHFSKALWKKPELNKKGSFIMKLDVEPQKLFQSYDLATKKYITHEEGGKGISQKWILGIDYKDPETGENQDTLVVSRSFFDKLSPDILDFVSENPGETQAKVNVRSIKGTNDDFIQLDFINIEKI